MYSGYGIAFDKAGWWSFGNDFARSVVIFGVENTLRGQTFTRLKTCEILWIDLCELKSALSESRKSKAKESTPIRSRISFLIQITSQVTTVTHLQ